MSPILKITLRTFGDNSADAFSQLFTTSATKSFENEVFFSECVLSGEYIPIAEAEINVCGFLFSGKLLIAFRISK